MAKKTSTKSSARRSTPYRATNLLVLASDVATKGLHFSLGATVLLVENGRQFFKKAIERGEKVEVKRNLERLASFSKKQVGTLRSFAERRTKAATLLSRRMSRAVAGSK